MKKKLIYNKDTAKEMLIQSNLIEDMGMSYAHDDAMKAWKYIVTVPKLSVASILRVHELLAQRVNPRIAGKFRDCDVYIGGNRKKYLGKNILEAQVSAVIYKSEYLIGWAKDKDNKIKEEVCKILHVAFEDVHPHEDINGRTYRLIYNWHRLRLGLPIDIIHTGQEQFLYYKWFKDSGSVLTEFIKRNNINI